MGFLQSWSVCAWLLWFRAKVDIWTTVAGCAPLQSLVVHGKTLSLWARVWLLILVCEQLWLLGAILRHHLKPFRNQRSFMSMRSIGLRAVHAAGLLVGANIHLLNRRDGIALRLWLHDSTVWSLRIPCAERPLHLLVVYLTLQIILRRIHVVFHGRRIRMLLLLICHIHQVHMIWLECKRIIICVLRRIAYNLRRIESTLLYLRHSIRTQMIRVATVRIISFILFLYVLLWIVNSRKNGGVPLCFEMEVWRGVVVVVYYLELVGILLACGLRLSRGNFWRLVVMVAVGLLDQSMVYLKFVAVSVSRHLFLLETAWSLALSAETAFWICALWQIYVCRGLAYWHLFVIFEHMMRHLIRLVLAD